MVCFVSLILFGFVLAVILIPLSGGCFETTVDKKNKSNNESTRGFPGRGRVRAGRNAYRIG